MFSLWGCAESRPSISEPPPAERLFTRLPAGYTHVFFENRLTPTESFNVFTYRNFYNGGGVGIADLNGDGRRDIYLTANQRSNRLYLNQGNLQFKDVTEAAGVGGQQPWSTGVSIADVNGDGLLDIYVCNAGAVPGDERANELFINQGVGPEGIPHFVEKAEAYGLSDTGYSVHAAFFDYDQDGDLDMYLVNNSPRPVSSFRMRNIRHIRHQSGGDRLYRNDGDRFTNVTVEAGIYSSEIAFGLGVSVGDINKDGWPDLYISNDFFERDYLYINNKDGTFREVLEEWIPQISLSSMGADMADINNDAYPEIYVTDMLPASDRRLKTMATFDSWKAYQHRVESGFHHQFMRNTLHLHNRNGTFSEISRVAGVASTGWSWGALIADFNLDGYKDIFVTNGIYRDLTNQDVIDMLGSGASIRQWMDGGEFNLLELAEKIPSTPIPNFMFVNQGDLTFTNKAADWGLATPSFSSGAAYGDLDNDGDLDLVVNNVNQKAFIYRNNADTLLNNNYLQVRLVGEGENPYGVGAKVTVKHEGQRFYLEQMPVRGFHATVDHVLTFGLGRIDTVEKVVVRWPDERVQVLTNVAANQTLTLKQKDAAPAESSEPKDPPEQLFMDVSKAVALNYRHVENDYSDFDRSPLLPVMHSTEGPDMAVGDVNGDGLDDVFIGGAKKTPGRLLVQQPGGDFVSTNEEVFRRDKISEDLGATFFDAEGDGDLDLYVVSGGSGFSTMAPALKDRLYINDGTGAFTESYSRLPGLYRSGSCVVPLDYDGDGDTDLFVGSRLVPWRYGYDPKSVLLENDGSGHFTNVINEVAPKLAQVGMITDAVAIDYNRDGYVDLVVVGAWMPISVFRNTGEGTFEQQTANAGFSKSSGWWNTIVVDDFDGDGDPDFVAGNLGLNTRIMATRKKPATLHFRDFDRDGYVEHIFSYAKNGTRYPMALRDELVRQVPFLAPRYPTHASYAEQQVTDVFTKEELQGAAVKYIHTLETSYIENLGDGRFKVWPLPFEAQLSPVYGILSGDFNRDGHKDLLLAGNLYEVNPQLGRMDASYGTYLTGDGTGHFKAMPTRKSGFFVRGQVRDMAYLDIPQGQVILIARNDDTVEVFDVQ